MELLSDPSHLARRDEVLPAQVVRDLVEVRSSYGLDYPAGLGVILDSCPMDDPATLVGRSACIRVRGHEPRLVRIADVRDHLTTISLFFQGLTAADVPIGSTVSVFG